MCWSPILVRPANCDNQSADEESQCRDVDEKVSGRREESREEEQRATMQPADLNLSLSPCRLAVRDRA